MPITSTLRHILDFYLHCFISFTVPQRLISQTLSFCLLNYAPRPTWFDFKLRFYVTKVFFFLPSLSPSLCFMILTLQPLYIGFMCSLECLLCLRSKCAEVQPQSAQITVDCQVWFAASNLLWEEAVRRVFFMVNPWQHTLIITLKTFLGKNETLHRASAILHGLCWRQTQKREHFFFFFLQCLVQSDILLLVEPGSNRCKGHCFVVSHDVLRSAAKTTFHERKAFRFILGCSFKAKMPTSCDKTTATATSTLISCIIASGSHSFSLEL